MPAPRGFSDFRIVREPAGADTAAPRLGAESADAVLSAGVRPSVSATDGAAVIKAPTPRASATAPTLTGPNPPPRPEIPTLGKGYSTKWSFPATILRRRTIGKPHIWNYRRSVLRQSPGRSHPVQRDSRGRNKPCPVTPQARAAPTRRFCCRACHSSDR